MDAVLLSGDGSNRFFFSCSLPKSVDTILEGDEGFAKAFDELVEQLRLEDRLLGF